MVGIPLVRSNRVGKVIISDLAVLDVDIEWLPVGSFLWIKDYVVVKRRFQPILNVAICVEYRVVGPYRNNNVRWISICGMVTVSPGYVRVVYRVDGSFLVSQIDSISFLAAYMIDVVLRVPIGR